MPCKFCTKILTKASVCFLMLKGIVVSICPQQRLAANSTIFFFFNGRALPL